VHFSHNHLFSFSFSYNIPRCLQVIAEEVASKEINEEKSLSFEFVQGLLGTLDSEWSRLVVRGLLSRMMSGVL